MKRAVLWTIGWALVALLAPLRLVFARVAPPEAAQTDFTPPDLPQDLDAWLAATEAKVPNLRPGAPKRILWAGAPGARRDWAVVYVHGFSASAQEIRPVPDRVAQALGANLYLARLTGHGRDGAALAQATPLDWSRDYAQSLAIGRRLGRRVLVIATSTGGTLAALAAHEGAAPDAIAFVSPNFGLANPAGRILGWPGARRYLPVLFGQTRNVSRDATPGYNTHWTTRYPTVALLPMGALVARVRRLDMGRIQVPALFYFAPTDRVVSAAATQRVARAWGGPVRVAHPTLGAGDDPMAHIIAGDIVSPSQTAPATACLCDWAKTL